MVFRDLIYGTFELPPSASEALGLPEISRLKGISLSNVPPAVLEKFGFRPWISSRLEHSLGVAYLASLHGIEYLIEAAIFHDSGLPPFSHMVEHLMEEDHEALSARIAEDNGYGRAAEVLRGRDPLSWLMSSDVDLDNLDNVGRFLVTSGISSSMGYDPVSASRSAKPEIGCFSGIVQIRKWVDARKKLYSVLYSWRNLSPHSVMATLIESLWLSGKIDPSFFSITDEEAMRILIRAFPGRMGLILSGRAPFEVLRLRGLIEGDWRKRHELEREIERALSLPDFSIFIFSGFSKENRKVRVKVCGRGLEVLGSEPEPMTILYAFRKVGRKDKILMRRIVEENVAGS